MELVIPGSMRVRLIILFLFVNLIASGTNYYIKTGGNDGLAGTSIANAWATISKVNTVWDAGTFAPGDSILFNRGDTFYGTIIADESGTAGSPIVVGAYGTGAAPIITGFTTIPSWTSYGGGIYYSATAVEDTSRLEMILFDGVQVAMGRWPDAGTWAAYDSYVGNSSITDAALPASPNYDGAELYFIKNTGLSSINRVTTHVDHTLNYKRMYSYGTMSNTNYFVQHHINTLTTANEWYYDGDTLFVYSGGSPPSATVQITTLDKLFKFTTYVDYINIVNLHFKGANLDCISANVEYQSGGQNDNITVYNCTVEYAGRVGIYIRGSDDWDVDSCTIKHCNDLGIWSTGTSYNTHVLDCTIRDIGLIHGSGQHAYYAGISMNQGSGQIIEYNQVKNVGRAAIGASIQDGYVRYNLVDSFCVNLTDDGGVYVGANTLSFENRVTINDNIILNGLTNSGGVNSSAAGIYIDLNNIYGNSILRNTIYNTTGAGIKLSNVTDVDIYDNLVYNCKAGIQLQDGAVVAGETPVSLDDLNITRNKFIAKTPAQILIWNRSDSVRQALYGGRLDSNYYARPIKDYGNFVYKYTYIDGADSLTWNEWKTYSTHEAHSSNSIASVTTTSDIFFYYNASTVNDSVFYLPVAMTDITGVEYNSTVTLDAWESIVLLKDYSPTANKGFAKSSTGTFMKDKTGTKFMKIE